MPKPSTFLTGLAVATRPHYDLRKYYERIIELLQTFPKNYAYRLQTEKMARERLEIVNANSDIDVVEKKINQGQIEEVIAQAHQEVELIKQFQTYKPWEDLVEDAPAHQWTWPPHK